MFMRARPLGTGDQKIFFAWRKTFAPEQKRKYYKKECIYTETPQPANPRKNIIQDIQKSKKNDISIFLLKLLHK